VKHSVGLFSILALMLFAVIFLSPALAQVSMPDYPMPPFQLLYSPDGSMIVGSADRLLRVWDAATGATLIDFPTMDTTYVLDVAWSPDSKRIATASDDQFLRVWNISDPNHTPGQLLQTIQPITGETGILTSVDWSPNGKFLAIGSAVEPFSLRIWDAANFVQIRQISAGWVERLDWNPDPDSNTIIVSDDNGGTTLFSDIDLPSNISSRHIGRNAPVSAMAWNADGSQMAVGYSDGKVIVWDSETDVQISEMIGTDQNRINQVSWSPDNTRIAAANGTVRIWYSQNGQLLETLPGKSISVDFSPDGKKLVYAAETDAIRIVDAPDISTATPHLTPSATIQSETQTLRDLLSYPTCQSTCFMGIEPGVTTQIELETLLDQIQLEFTHASIASGHLILYTVSPLSSPFLADDKPVYIDVTADHVDLMTLFLQDVTLAQITNEYGAPDAIVGGDEASKFIIYIAEGLIFATESPDKDSIGLVFLTPPGRNALRINSYLSDFAPCSGSVTLCGIPIATPTP
jgi:hypothetical protein